MNSIDFIKKEVTFAAPIEKYGQLLQSQHNLANGLATTQYLSYARAQWVILSGQTSVKANMRCK